MANLMDLVQGQLSDNLINQLSQQLGGTDRQQTANATNGIMSLLMNAMARNASTPQGASALASALDRDHDGSVLDDVMGMLSGKAQPTQARAMNGVGILKHVLGGKQNNAVDMISKMSGLDNNKTGNLMAMLAPVALGILGRTKRQNRLDAGGLASLLSKGVGSMNQQQSQEMGFIGRFLDQDGDGSFMDDVAGMGMNVLGNLFKKK